MKGVSFFLLTLYIIVLMDNMDIDWQLIKVHIILGETKLVQTIDFTRNAYINIFLKGYSVLVRVEIIHKSKFLPGTVEKNSSTIRSSGRNRTYACAMHMPVHCSVAP